MKKSVQIVLFLILTAGFCDSAFSQEAKKNTCLKCHEKKLLSSKVKHEPAVKDCMLCHDLHGKQTGQPKRLLKAANVICQDCHKEEIFSGKPGHPVKNHPTADKGVSCLSCHNPHATETRKLIRFNLNDEKYQGNLCKACHDYKTRKQ